jgi:hypothetical protein
MLTGRARRVPAPPPSHSHLRSQVSASHPRIDDSARTLISSPLSDLWFAAVHRCLLCLDSVARRPPRRAWTSILPLCPYLPLPVLSGVPNPNPLRCSSLHGSRPSSVVSGAPTAQGEFLGPYSFPYSMILSVCSLGPTPNPNSSDVFLNVGIDEIRCRVVVEELDPCAVCERSTGRGLQLCSSCSLSRSSSQGYGS